MMKQTMRNQHANNNHKGFSLPELMIVISIVGIMATLSLQLFTRNKNEEKLKLASKSLIQYLQAAQIRSQQELESCKVNINHATLVLSISNSNDCRSLAPVDLKETIKGMKPSDLKICGTSTTSNSTMACDATNDGSDVVNGNLSTSTSLTFTPRGTVSQGGLLKLHSEQAKRTRCIAVTSPLGLIREGRASGTDCDFNIF